ncbi:MAG TPA: WhiB family transcriptional regulator [Mycobacterium sp.]|nr:WhiB family transcriptional regulator [Mycobacterium sp.]
MTAEWMTRSLCRIPAYRPLFADQRPHGMSQTQRNAAAKAVCGRCPEEATCLTYAMQAEGTTAASHRAGIYAGRTAAERAQLAGADTDDDHDGAA